MSTTPTKTIPLADLMAPITAELQALEPRLVEYLLTPNDPTNQVIRHIFASGGKRLRPALFFLSALAIGYEGEHLYPIASVCEYIHTASLLHDDVIDNSTIRRGRPTANSIWGDETAILSGDLIYSAACRLMVRTASLPLIDTFAECIRFMSESELFQLDLLWKSDVTQEQYIKLISGKTAALFEASTKTPGYLMGLPSEVTEDLGAYGHALGLAFQIADDVLDYTGDVHEVGKDLLKDLQEGKVTLPVILALQNESQNGGSTFAACVAAALENPNAVDTQNLLAQLHHLEGLEMARAQAHAWMKMSQQSLERAYSRCPAPHARAQDARWALSSLADFVVGRTH